MDAHDSALRRYFEAQRDRPFSASQAASALSIDEHGAKSMLKRFASDGTLSELARERFIFTSSADVVAYNILLEVAPNVTFQEFVSHKDEPHVLVRLSRDREIAKGLALQER